MYFPYLRGKQYELIAIRELVDIGKLSEKVIPIIEPVTTSSTLLNTLEKFNNVNHPISIIGNPSVGKFSLTFNNDEAYREQFLEKINNNNIIKAYIANDGFKTMPALQRHSLEELMIIFKNRQAIDEYESVYSGKEPRYVLMPSNSIRSFRKIGNRKNKVIYEDWFNKQKRSADYLDTEDEDFSEEHLYFKEEGFVGYSDFSVVGDEYMDKGFAPYAVAIHIIYWGEDNYLRIRHFVSDTNDSIEDPAGKFAEAMYKLKNWYDEQKDPRLNTEGLKGFIKHAEDGTYPGLGVVKKLSIMHHIELIGNYFDDIVS